MVGRGGGGQGWRSGVPSLQNNPNLDLYVRQILIFGFELNSRTDLDILVHSGDRKNEIR